MHCCTAILQIEAITRSVKFKFHLNCSYNYDCVMSLPALIVILITIPKTLAIYDSTYFLPTWMKWAVINFSNYKHCEKWLSMNGYYRLSSMLDYLLIKLPLHETIFPSWKGSSVLHEHTSTSHHHNFSALGCTRTLRHEPEFSWQSPTIQLHALRPHSTQYIQQWSQPWMYFKFSTL